MAIKTWLGTDGTSPTAFNLGDNWSDGVAPGTGDTLVFSASYNNSCLTNLDFW